MPDFIRLLPPLLLAAAAGAPAPAHQAPSGWEYPLACCSNHDCREVSAAAVSERPAGYVIRASGEVVGYSDPRVRRSPDGAWHVCSAAGAETGRTICLFVPDRNY